MLVGMNVAAGPELAAAVTNAGGLGVIGGVGYTPKVLRAQVRLNRSPIEYKDISLCYRSMPSKRTFMTRTHRSALIYSSHKLAATLVRRTSEHPAYASFLQTGSHPFI